VPDHWTEDPEKVRRVLDVTLLTDGVIELPEFLRRVLGEAHALTGARYGALGVLNEDGTALAEFLTIGLEGGEERRIGSRPTGRGVLGILMSDPRPLRVARLASHPDRYGFPPHHPPMTSFLGVPLKVRDEVHGVLYLTDKMGWPEFTLDDVALVEALAQVAGIAFERARFPQQSQIIAAYEERDRTSRELHDAVIQRLFGAGLSLQTLAARTSAEVTQGLEAVVAEIDQVIQQIRATISDDPGDEPYRGIRDDIVTLVRELSGVVHMEIPITFDGPVDSALTGQMVDHLFAMVRESVTTSGTVGHATRASVKISVEEGWCRVTVLDDGVAGAAARNADHRLADLRQRTEGLHGTLLMEHPPGGGTLLTWRVPLHP
jgi:signal transduction histidine kinase